MDVDFRLQKKRVCVKPKNKICRDAIQVGSCAGASYGSAFAVVVVVYFVSATSISASRFPMLHICLDLEETEEN